MFWQRCGPVRSEPPSAALDVLLDDDAAVPEERAGQGLQEGPGVGAGVERLHVAERRAFAAHDAPRGVDLPVQDGGAAEGESKGKQVKSDARLDAEMVKGGFKNLEMYRSSK